MVLIWICSCHYCIFWWKYHYHYHSTLQLLYDDDQKIKRVYSSMMAQAFFGGKEKLFLCGLTLFYKLDWICHSDSYEISASFRVIASLSGWSLFALLLNSLHFLCCDFHWALGLIVELAGSMSLSSVFYALKVSFFGDDFHCGVLFSFRFIAVPFSLPPMFDFVLGFFSHLDALMFLFTSAHVYCFLFFTFTSFYSMPFSC